MKLFKQTLLASLAFVAASSFASSNTTGVDQTGTGNVTFTGTSVSTCTAPTLTVSLGNVDFHVVANGPTGVYQRNVDISVNCTNPTQTWMVAPHVTSFQFASGVNGANTEQGYVSFAAPASVPGTDWSDMTALMNALMDPNATAQDMLNATQQSVGAVGTGTSTFTSQLTFGKALSAGVVADQIVTDIGAPMVGGVPTGTIDGRGAFNVDIPLQIIY